MDAAFLTSAILENQYPPPDRPEIAFSGRSNVGKSSLLNVLVNRKGLAKTSSTPGRTQTINFFRVGKELYFVDLPGYGYAKVPIQVKKSWQKMVETYLRNRPNLKAVVLILDIRREPSGGDLELFDWLKYYRIHPIVVCTKIDKVSKQEAMRRANLIKNEFAPICPVDPTLFSAKTRKGREEIWERIRQCLDTPNRERGN